MGSACVCALWARSVMAAKPTGVLSKEGSCGFPLYPENREYICPDQWRVTSFGVVRVVVDVVLAAFYRCCNL